MAIQQKAPLWLREDQANIQVIVDGITWPSSVTGSWTTLKGGAVQSEDTFARPGGMLPGVNLGGPSKRTDITVTRPYTPDLHNMVIALENACGHTAASASYTPLDKNKNPNGVTIHIPGMLKEVTHPDLDANNTAAGYLTLVIAADLEATSS